MMDQQSLNGRRAIEALRAGVPNRAAVARVSVAQPLVERRFTELLAQLVESQGQGHQPAGFLVEGDFGTGKSHTLQYLQHLALEANCACSLVVISKESPLSDLQKVFQAAIEHLRLPDRPGRSGLTEVAGELKFNSASYAAFYKRVQDPSGGLDPIFGATLLLYERIRSDPEFLDRIVAFWSGDKIEMRDLKQALKAVHASRPEVRSRRVAELAPERLRFAAQLLLAAGYKGWVILVDEVELVASMGLVTRAKSYASLALMLGHFGSDLPGILTIASVTSDFAVEVFATRGDDRQIKAWLGPVHGELVQAALAGIQCLTQSSWAERLRPPNAATLRRTREVLERLYGEAYGWTPPQGDGDVPDRSANIRRYVRSLITEWDLSRLFPGAEHSTEAVDIRPNLAESEDLESPVEGQSNDEGQTIS